MKKIWSNQNTRHTWYYQVLIWSIASAGILSSIFTYAYVRQTIQTSLLQRVDTIGTALDTDQIKSLAGDETDLNNPAYVALKMKLEKIRALNPDVRFIYLSGHREGNPFFFVDSEPADSPDVSPPGQVYEEASPVFRSVFVEQQPIIEGIFTDRWGTWLTALAPIIDPSTNELVAIIGMDVNAWQYFWLLAIYSAIPVFIAIFLFMIIGFLNFIKREEEKSLALRAEILTRASHEIRSPLIGVVLVFNELLRNPSEFSGETTETLKLVRNSCQNMLGTVNEFLAIYSLQNQGKKLAMDKVDAQSLIREMIDSLNLTTRQQKIEIIFGSIRPILIWGNKDRLKVMFNNLLSNAVKYSKEGGKVKINIEEGPKTYVFSIKDTGIGIPEAEKSKIFGGFFRASNATSTITEGTGLGLYYVKQIVSAHGGEISLESEEGKGTTFRVELPRVTDR